MTAIDSFFFVEIKKLKLFFLFFFSLYYLKHKNTFFCSHIAPNQLDLEFSLNLGNLLNVFADHQ
jgi:hypothetical protein